MGAIESLALKNPNVTNTNNNGIAGVTQFVVLQDGSLYKARFSLIDQDGATATSDAHVHAIVDRFSGIIPVAPIIVEIKPYIKESTELFNSYHS